MITKSLQICFASLLISAAVAWAAQPVGPARLEGDVKDAKGQPVAGAEVHLRGSDGSGERIVRTGQNGPHRPGRQRDVETDSEQWRSYRRRQLKFNHNNNSENARLRPRVFLYR